MFDDIFNYPQSIHWHILLDVADFAKRESRPTEARLLFKMITYMQPYAYQGWVEYAKMEEECGNVEKCRKLLLVGIRFNPLNENLFIKALKVEEKLERYDNVRSLLASLRDIPIEKTWKMILEGALFEGRCGNLEAARRVFHHLFTNCPTYGPIFHDAARFEERVGCIEQALKTCEEGLNHNVKYGPLWFLYLRLVEKAGREYKSPFACSYEALVENQALLHVSRELMWKVYLDVAAYYERAKDLEHARNYLYSAGK